MAAYTIKKGDTLSKIAKANNTTVDAIAKANNIKNVNRIRTGSSLTLPGAATTTTGASGTSAAAGAANAAGATPAATVSASGTSRWKSKPYAEDLYNRLLAGGFDTSGYDQIASNYSAQMNNIRSQYQQMAAQSEAAARAEAEQNRRQAYVNGRLSANRNNEQVAALGLGGNIYDDAMSGYSETSRIAADNNMRTNINQVTLAEQSAINEIALKLMDQNATLSMQEAQQLAAIQLQAQQAAQQAYEANIAAQISVIGTMGNYDQWDYEVERNAVKDAQWQKEYELKLKQLKAKGSGSGSGSKLIGIDPALWGYIQELLRKLNGNDDDSASTTDEGFIRKGVDGVNARGGVNGTSRNRQTNVPFMR
nr:MAG TPA: LysM domain [Caudoviricetes sp.]